MTTYVYEIIPTKEGETPRYVEIKQGMKDAPLTKHPETGKAIRRVIFGGYGALTKGNDSGSGSGCGPGQSCGQVFGPLTAHAKGRPHFGGSGETEFFDPRKRPGTPRDYRIQPAPPGNANS